jgi:hypothetical protein
VPYINPSGKDSWDWLMPVVQKIEQHLFAVEIKENHCLISGYRKYEGIMFYVKDVFKDKITATYETVFQFIQWYNTIKTPAGSNG